MISPLEVMVDVPSLDDARRMRNDQGTAFATASGHPLNVLIYFHGHGGESCCIAPCSMPGCAVIALQCPSFVSEGLRCFWFTEGPGGAWDRHEHDKLQRCEVMLTAVGNAVDAILTGLGKLDFPQGVKREVFAVGVSMGGCAVLEFARAFPDLVRGAAVISGYYNKFQILELVDAIADIPLLLVHSREDRACPF